MINHGIISNGDKNTNIIINDEYSTIEKELNILINHNIEPEVIKEALSYYKRKEQSKFIKCLKKLSLETLHIIKELSLTTLQKYIEKYILKL